MAETETVLEADGLRVVFFRSGDRYAHRFDVLDAAGNTWTPNCYSLEGEPDDDWPPSPPFQQLHVEDRPTGRVILLVGMAGRTHWSAAVEVAADRKSIAFDVAARVQAEPKDLSSEYRYLAAGGDPVEPLVQIEWNRCAPPTSYPATCSWRYVASLRA
jgi:hypothetical protein